MACLICCFCLGVAEPKFVSAYLSLRYILHAAGTLNHGPITKKKNKEKKRQANKESNQLTKKKKKKKKSKKKKKKKKERSKPTNQPTSQPTSQPTNQPTNQQPNSIHPPTVLCDRSRSLSSPKQREDFHCFLGFSAVMESIRFHPFFRDAENKKSR